ncbi:MAG: glycosyltransferase family A protein [Arenicella sp.]
MTIKFSIIVVDYDQSVNRAYMQRAIRSIMAQSFSHQEIETILLHDGPKETPYDIELNDKERNFIDSIVITEKRYNDWGHSLRDLGIRQAKGEYIIHLNADNVLYSNALERLAFHASANYPPIFDAAGNIKNTNDILIFCLYMKGVVFCNGGFSRRPGQEDIYSIILTGIPTKFRNIDCMQLVMKREKWLKENGWSNRSRNSDGIMYPEFTQKYGARYIAELLGEHW